MVTQDIPRGLKLHDLGGIEVVAGRYRYHALPRHIHDGLMLSLLSDGVQVLHYRGVAHSAGRGMILAVPPHEVHAAVPGDDDGWYYHTVTIPTDVLEQHQSGSSHFSCQTAIYDDQFTRRLALLFRSLNGSSLLEKEGALSDVLEWFLSRYADLPDKTPGRPTELRAVEICKAYLAAHLDQNVSLIDLSRLARIDRFLLVRSFTAIVGMPPHAWHMQRRLHKSLEMLSQGEPVAEVAAATGFADQAHLTRVFKRVTGITPGRFRRDHVAFQSHGSVISSRILSLS
jgi:AraC-like DNA-binding protein